MSRLEQLADLIERGALADGDRRDIAALLRAASAETVGTEWAVVCDPDDESENINDRCGSRVNMNHNADLHAARLAIADLRAERDAKQRAIDEVFDVLDAGHGMLACREAAHILRPHATKATEANSSATVTGSTTRKWRREYYHDRSFWVNWRVSESRPERQCDLYKKEELSVTFDGLTRLDDDTWCLEWQEGDTADNLPPLPDRVTNPDTVSRLEPATPAADACELVARLAEIMVGLIGESDKDGVPVNDWTVPLRELIAAARRGGGA